MPGREGERSGPRAGTVRTRLGCDLGARSAGVGASALPPGLPASWLRPGAQSTEQAAGLCSQ